MCTVWSDSVGEAKGREEVRGGARGTWAEVEEADTHPPLSPLSHPFYHRAATKVTPWSRVVKSGKKEETGEDARKKRIDYRCRELTEEPAKSGPWIRLYLSRSLAGVWFLRVWAGPESPHRIKDFGLGWFRETRASLYVSLPVSVRVFVSSRVYRSRVRDDGSRRGIDDEEREAEKEQGRQKRARVYMCVRIYSCTSLFLLSSSRVYTNPYTRVSYVYARMYVYMRARPITCVRRNLYL